MALGLRLLLPGSLALGPLPVAQKLHSLWKFISHAHDKAMSGALCIFVLSKTKTKQGLALIIKQTQERTVSGSERPGKYSAVTTQVSLAGNKCRWQSCQGECISKSFRKYSSLFLFVNIKVYTSIRFAQTEKHLTCGVCDEFSNYLFYSLGYKF